VKFLVMAAFGFLFNLLSNVYGEKVMLFFVPMIDGGG